MRWLITGASGLLGQHISRLIPPDDEQVGWFYRTPIANGERVDVRDKFAVDAAMANSNFDICIHCAAEPNIESCEASPEAAQLLNVTGTKNIADACAMFGVRLIFVSTDYVFDGKLDEPYDEMRDRFPLQGYGRTKVEAEDYAELIVEESMNARIPLLYGRIDAQSKKTWFETTIESLHAGQTVFADDTQIRQPAAAEDIARTLIELARTKHRGQVHVAPNETLTKYAWGQLIAKSLGFDTDLVQPTYDTSQQVPRPMRPTLATKRLHEFKMELPRDASTVLQMLTS